MGKNGVFSLRLCVLGFYLCFAALCPVQSDATNGIHRYKTRKHFRSTRRNANTKWVRKNYFNAIRKFDINVQLDDVSNTDPYVSSPFSLPPFDALAPITPLTQNAPPYCINPPFTPQPPSTIPSPTGGSTPLPPLGPIPSPTGGYTPLPPPGPNPPSIPIPPESPPIPNPPSIPIPPESPPIPNTPTIIPNPPSIPIPPESPPIPNTPTITPNPPTIIPNPPATVPTPTEPILSPPYFEPSPPYSIPSPTGPVPRSPRFLPPIVFPPPSVPPPPYRGPTTAMWCVAKAAVPDPIMQEAMDYACGSGADCSQIQPSGPCFQPTTVFAHASYAFNSYWQRTKVTGGRCDFGGTAILVTVDPSFDGCHFIYF